MIQLPRRRSRIRAPVQCRAQTRSPYRGHNSDNAAQYRRWGLIPSWAKDLKQRPQPVDLKAETVDESRMFTGVLDRIGRLCPAPG